MHFTKVTNSSQIKIDNVASGVPFEVNLKQKLLCDERTAWVKLQKFTHHYKRRLFNTVLVSNYYFQAFKMENYIIV